MIDKEFSDNPNMRNEFVELLINNIGKRDKFTKEIFTIPTLFIFYDEAMNPLYVGTTLNIKETYKKFMNSSKVNEEIFGAYRFIGLSFFADSQTMTLYEKILINGLSPKYNSVVPSFLSDADFTKYQSVISSIDNIDGKFRPFVFSKKTIEEFAIPVKRKVIDPKPQTYPEQIVDNFVGLLESEEIETMLSKYFPSIDNDTIEWLAEHISNIIKSDWNSNDDSLKSKDNIRKLWLYELDDVFEVAKNS